MARPEQGQSASQYPIPASLEKSRNSLRATEGWLERQETDIEDLDKLSRCLGLLGDSQKHSSLPSNQPVLFFYHKLPANKIIIFGSGKNTLLSKNILL